MIPGGQATGTTSLQAFQKLVGLAGTINTGFVVLEHDLFQQEVEMSVGYFLPTAFANNFKVSVSMRGFLRRLAS
jgi:hypothetical protein